MVDQLPKKIWKQEGGIINLDNHYGPGSHWTAYKKHNNIVTYFDSFGNLKPDPRAVKYFQSNGACKIVFNHTPHQTYNSFNCGHLCLEFLYNK